jgi:hypothetical protein
VGWKVTIRTGPRVEREHFDVLDAALDAIEARGRELAKTKPTDVVDVRVKRFDPVQQVVARIELAGPQRLVPSVRGGVDVRGDGSTEAYVGRLQREVVKQRKGENAFSALRRAVSNANEESA